MRFVVTLIATLTLLAPSAALAQDGNPFDGQLPPAAPTPTPTVAPVESASDADVSRQALFVVGGALLALFVGIGVWIARDARTNLPPDERDDRNRLRDEGPHRHARQAKAKARAKGRAQRRARKAARKARR